MIIGLKDIQKAFVVEEVLKNVTFTLEEKEKAALIGVNGAGKSTLFKIITGEMSADSGDIFLPKTAKVGYFSQSLEIDSEKSIYDELLTVFDEVIAIEDKMRTLEQQMSLLSGEALEKNMQDYSALSHELEQRNGYEYQSRIRGVIKGLGFDDSEFYKPIRTLSGGQKTRVALGRLLLSAPDLLLLDEPTNHLYIDSIQWLEDYLNNYPNSLIIISHDRYFLNRVTKKTIEIENGRSTVYFGNYSFYVTQKEIEREIARRHFVNQQREIKHQQQVIEKLRSFNREKSIKRAESREKQLEKVELVEAPENLPDKIRLAFTPERESGNDVLTVKGLEKGFDNRRLFKNVSFEIKKGERIALIGANGIGKTTLFKIIMDRLRPDAGTSVLGANVFIGYYDQEQEDLSLDKTIFDEVSDTHPTLSNLIIRNALAAFVFTGDDVFKTISSLSGGEKGRVALAKIMLGKANFLILDEPTNHLDLNSKEILENALVNYPGTVLYISHDRYFINRTATRLLELTPDGVNSYLGNYDFYLETKANIPAFAAETQPAAETQSSIDWKRQKEEQAAKRKLENQINKIEEKIAETEEKIAECDTLLEQEEVFSSAAKSAEVFNKKTKLEEELAELYEQWESLQA
ncbi:MAG: ABC-F family ATP-binding cassette domain-containing protein [Firmicutes bacterium]|nr:ABC-F family ATP-binding cassette domain-containing protein [Bacillota bacterium]